MKNKILTIVLLLCCCPIFLLAQKDNSGTFGISAAPVFYSFSNLSGINNSLKSYNYPTLKTNGAGYSFSLIIGDTSDLFYELIDVGQIYTSGPRSNNFTTSLSEFRSMLTFNFNLNASATNKRKILTGPILGLGLSATTLSIVNKSQAPQTFDSSLASLKGQRTITSNAAVILNVGWAAQKYINKNHNCFLALRAGYDLDLNHPKWQYNNSNLSGNPKTNLSGLYASLQLGIVLRYSHT